MNIGRHILYSLAASSYCFAIFYQKIFIVNRNFFFNFIFPPQSLPHFASDFSPSPLFFLSSFLTHFIREVMLTLVNTTENFLIYETY